jgi:hypothetical protein
MIAKQSYLAALKRYLSQRGKSYTASRPLAHGLQGSHSDGGQSQWQ